MRAWFVAVSIALTLGLVAAAPAAEAQTSGGVTELSSGIRPGGAVPYGQAGVHWSWTAPAGQYFALVRISYSLHSFEHAATLRCWLHRPNEGHFDIGTASVTGAPSGGIGVNGELTLMSQVSLVAPTPLIVTCDAPFGGPTGTQTVDHLRLELIQASSFAPLPVTPNPAPSRVAR